MIKQPRTIWILQTGEPLHIDRGNSRPMRAMNLSNVLVDSGHKVVLWSTAFYHQEKRHRSSKKQSIRVTDNLEIRLIPSCGYQRNVGLGRLIDHAQLAINLKKMLIRCKDLPDVAFVGFPPIETAAVMVQWLSKRGIPTLLDVKDQWPSIFLETIPSFIQPLGRIILWPYFHLAKRTMQGATGISAMANGFLVWALNFAGRDRTDADGVFPLTSQLDQVSEEELDKARQWWDSQGVLDDGTMRICYVGNHSPNVDLLPIRDAASQIIKQNLPVDFIIAGDGVSSVQFKTMMSGFQNVHFPGRIDRPKFMALAERSHVLIIPYINSANFQLSLPNKIFDGLALGLPILSPLQGEVSSLVAENGVGMHYGTDTGMSLIDCIHALIKDDSLQKSMSLKARVLYAERFSFEKVYGGLAKNLEMLAQKSELQKYALYQAKADTWESPDYALEQGYYTEEWRPRLFSIAPRELLTPTFAAWWLFHWLKIFKNSQYKILLIYTQEKKLAHYTVILPAHFRFPFMQACDVQIGPIGTISDFRKDGLALYALSQIAREYKNTHRCLWYVARKENEPSRKLIEKLNFSLIGEAIKIKRYHSKLFSKYALIDNTPFEYGEVRSHLSTGVHSMEDEKHSNKNPDNLVEETSEWYARYYKKKGILRNDLLKNKEVLWQHLAFEKSIFETLNQAHDISNEEGLILDVGCGNGGSLSKFLQLGFISSNLYGIDIQKDRIEDGKKKYPGVNFLCGQANQMDFKDSMFDLAMESTMFMQITDDAVAGEIAEEMIRVVKRNKYLLLVDWRYGNPLSAEYKGLGIRRLSKLFSIGTKTRLVYIGNGALIPPIGRFLSKRLPALYFPVQFILRFLVGQKTYLLTKC